MTECTQSTFEFASHFSRQVVARFDGGTITTDGGGLLLRETDRRLNLLPRLAECFLDARSPLAGKSTLNRLELSDGTPNRYKKITFWKDGIDELLVKVFVESHAAAPEEIVLDVDATDLPLHGEQEGRFFHGYYDSYCYLPLYIFCGDQILCARLRQSNSDAAAGSLEEIERIVKQIR